MKDGIEKDPTGKKLGEAGAKVDAGKAPVLRGCMHYFPRAVLAVAEISDFGVQKGYAWNSWETVSNGIGRYGDALARHLLKEAIEGPLDSQSKKLHAAHEAWNAMARLELILREQEQVVISLLSAPIGGGGGGRLESRFGLSNRRVAHPASCPVCEGTRTEMRLGVEDRRTS